MGDHVVCHRLLGGGTEGPAGDEPEVHLPRGHDEGYEEDAEDRPQGESVLEPVGWFEKGAVLLDLFPLLALVDSFQHAGALRYDIVADMCEGIPPRDHPEIDANRRKCLFPPPFRKVRM